MTRVTGTVQLVKPSIERLGSVQIEQAIATDDIGRGRLMQAFIGNIPVEVEFAHDDKFYHAQFYVTKIELSKFWLKSCGYVALMPSKEVAL